MGDRDHRPLGDASRHETVTIGGIIRGSRTLLAVAPDSLAFAGFAVLFGLILSADRYFLPVLDDAYRQLRLQLSSVVVAAVATAAIATHGAS